jgi:hypothetical protein
MKIDDTIKARPPTLPKGYKLDELVEGQLLLRLISDQAEQRPSVEEIKS